MLYAIDEDYAQNSANFSQVCWEFIAGVMTWDQYRDSLAYQSTTKPHRFSLLHTKLSLLFHHHPQHIYPPCPISVCGPSAVKIPPQLRTPATDTPAPRSKQPNRRHRRMHPQNIPPSRQTMPSFPSRQRAQEAKLAKRYMRWNGAGQLRVQSHRAQEYS